ncbi:MAG TPA: hypothetical protein GX528_05375 [Firmicutes bacterium]|nr:hypothetical protein [Bacillota bacterium]
MKDFAMELEDKLAIIHDELKTGKYEPSPVKRVEIEKGDGGKRPLVRATLTIKAKALGL